MKISIVTAVYNREDTVGQAISSVQSQTYSKIEHMIQDGGSTDRTIENIRNLNFPNIALESKRDRGIYDAINLGIGRATGDIIGLMHSDDFFANDDVLSKVANAFTDSSIDGVYGDLDYVSNSDENKIVRQWRSGEFSQSKLRSGWMPPHPTLYLRRSVFDKFGLYDTNFKIAADYDAMLRYLGMGQIKLAYIPEVLVKMRVGGESNRSFWHILQKSREDYRAIKRNNVGGIGTLVRKNAQKIRQFF